MPANADIVAHLNQVVDLCALADDRVADCTAIDGRAGSYLDIVLNDNAPDLRHLEMPIAAHHVSKAILTDLAARMNDDPIAYQGIGHRRIRADRALAPNPDSGANHGIGSNHAATADFGAGANHRARLDGHAVFGQSTFVDMSLGKIAGIGQR